MRGILLTLGAVVLLLAPVGQAVPAEGNIVAAGAWRLSGTPGGDVEAWGAFMPTTDALNGLVLTATRVEVILLHTTSAAAVVVDVAPRVERRTYVLNDVEATLSGGSSPGWLGFYLADSRVISLASNSGIRGIDARDAIYGNIPTTSEGQPDPALNGYSIRVDQPHLKLQTDGVVTIEGNFALKFLGPDIHVRARENTTTIRTGYTPPPSAAGVAENDWVVLQVEGGALQLHTAIPMDIPVSHAALDWRESIVMRARAGQLETEGATYLARNDEVTVNGIFHGGFDPAETEGTTSVQLTGDLHATTMARGTVATPSSGGPVGKWLVWGVLSVISAGAGAYVARRRMRGGTRHLLPEDNAYRAAEAAEAEDYETALRWIREVRKASPLSATAATDEAFFLEKLGDVAAALAAYGDASALASDGEPDYLAFRLAMSTGLVEEANRRLRRALKKDPGVLLEVESAKLEDNLDDETLDLIRAARRHLDGL